MLATTPSRSEPTLSRSTGQATGRSKRKLISACLLTESTYETLDVVMWTNWITLTREYDGTEDIWINTMLGVRACTQENNGNFRWWANTGNFPGNDYSVTPTDPDDNHNVTDNTIVIWQVEVRAL